MAITAHVHQVYLAATPEQVWTAITDSAWTRRWFHATSFVEPPVEGRPYRTTVADGSPAVEGEIVEMRPPTPDQPGRFVQTWHVLYDDDLEAEPPGQVEWTIEAAGPGLTRVRLVHGDLAGSPLTWARVKDGWPWVLDSLKTLLETGTTLPPTIDRATSRESADGATGDAALDAAWHRAQGIEANNSVWELIGTDERTPDDDEELLRRAYAAAYHWQRAAAARPENEARAAYMIAKALLLVGEPAASLRSAERCLRVCRDHGLVDFDLAYAHEARARALLALDRRDEAAAAWAAATAVTIADPEDRAILEGDFADYPG